MKVYIPFKDGSAVSYDGEKFFVHKRPVTIDADLSELSGCTAETTWRERRGEMVKALEAAWWKEHEHSRKNQTKRIYSGLESAKPEAAKSETTESE